MRMESEVLMQTHGFYRSMCVCMHIHTQAYTYINAFISLLCLLRRPRTNYTPVAVSIPSSPILVSEYYSPLKGTGVPKKNGLIPGLGQKSTRGDKNISLFHKVRKCSTNARDIPKDIGTN